MGAVPSFSFQSQRAHSRTQVLRCTESAWAADGDQRGRIRIFQGTRGSRIRSHNRLFLLSQQSLRELATASRDILHNRPPQSGKRTGRPAQVPYWSFLLPHGRQHALESGCSSLDSQYLYSHKGSPTPTVVELIELSSFTSASWLASCGVGSH